MEDTSQDAPLAGVKRAREEVAEGTEAGAKAAGGEGEAAAAAPASDEPKAKKAKEAGEPELDGALAAGQPAEAGGKAAAAAANAQAAEASGAGASAGVPAAEAAAGAEAEGAADAAADAPSAAAGAEAAGAAGPGDRADTAGASAAAAAGGGRAAGAGAPAAAAPAQAADPPAKIGYRTFRSGNEASAYFQDLIHNLTRDQDLNEYEHHMVLELIKAGHETPAQKLGAGVRAVQVRDHQKFEEWTSCFFLLRADGSVDDVSARKCIMRIFPAWAAARPTKFPGKARRPPPPAGLPALLEG